MMHRHERAIHHYFYSVIIGDQFQAHSKKKLIEHSEQQNKANQILAMLLVRKIVSMKTFYEEHSSKTFVKKFSLKSHILIPKEDVLLKARSSPK